MATPALLYLGTKSHVVALDQATGAEVWRTPLKGGTFGSTGFVSLLVEEGRVFAHTNGQLFCLEAGTGNILWANPLTGLGYDLASLATERAGISADSIVRKARELEAARQSNT